MWKVITGQRLECRGWDDEFVVYNSLSGDTHLLGGAAMDILLLLQKNGPMDERGLYAALCDSAAPGAEAGDDDELDVVLDELRSLALLERV